MTEREAPDVGRRDGMRGATLRRRIMLTSALGVMIVLGTLAWLGSIGIAGVFGSESKLRLRDAAQRSSSLIDHLLVERQREMDLLISSPMVVDAARAGSRRSESLGLPNESMESLERRYSETRTLGVDDRLRSYLTNVSPRIGVIEAMLTDRFGHNAVITTRTQDFVQSDEAWWEAAKNNGSAPTEAAFDEWSKQVVVTMASAVRDPATGNPAGVLKLTFGLARTDSALASAAATGGGVEVDLVDANNNIIASSTSATRMKQLASIRVLAMANDSVVIYGAGNQITWAAAVPVGTLGWRVVAHVPERLALTGAESSRRALLFGTAGFGLLLLAGLWSLDRFVTRRISAPAAMLAEAAEAVAAGDLSIELRDISQSDDEIGRLSRATAAMIEELRRLVGAMSVTSSETAAMASQITSGAGAMAQTAEAMATTSNDLSAQSGTMSTMITQFAGDATRLVAISSELDTGSQEGLQRNVTLRELAAENRQRLDESSMALQALSADVSASASAADALAGASEEIRNFVTFVQKMARQSKLLALNAAMEAARAGVHGQGFAVVASEVRRLAAGAGEAAEKTEQLVRDVLARVGESRDSTARTVQAVQSVIGATKQGLESFAQIESAVAENEEWMRAISRASAETHALIGEMTKRLESVSRTTESFAASMEEVAASSEEQSASTADIAHVAKALAASADELSRIVATFQLGVTTSEQLEAQPVPAPVPAPARGTPGVPTHESLAAHEPTPV
jgi:methyl-accepting chemotaxis protein